MIIELTERNIKFLQSSGIKEGEYPVESFIEGGTEFIFPSDKNDFKIKIFKQNGKTVAELPELEPANEGKYLDLLPGEGTGYPGQIWAIYC